VRRAQALPRLHLVTDERVVVGGGFLETAEALLQSGGPRVALHLRAPALSGRRLFERAEALAAVARETGALLLVNDRVDVAVAAGVGGVQLAARSLPPDEARRLLGRDAWIGVSVHSAEEGRAAQAAGVDFVVAGTLYESRSHPGRRGTGVEWLRALATDGVPIVGIGGITLERVAEVLGAGAHGVAVIRAVWDAPRPAEAVEAFLKALHERDGE
jgi:thiamine-phosphate diphosphorylase